VTNESITEPGAPHAPLRSFAGARVRAQPVTCIDSVATTRSWFDLCKLSIELEALSNPDNQPPSVFCIDDNRSLAGQAMVFRFLLGVA